MRETGDVAARPRQTFDQTGAEWVNSHGKYYRDDGCRLLCCRSCRPGCDNDIDFKPDELGRNFRETFAVPICSAKLNDDGASHAANEIRTCHQSQDRQDAWL
jgi:hypothetical protein